MPDDTAVVEPPVTPEAEVDPADRVRALLFGTPEELETIQTQYTEEKKKEEEDKAAKEAAAKLAEPPPEAATPKKPKAAPKPKPAPVAEPEEKEEPEPEPKPRPPKKLSTEELIRLNAEASRDAVVAGVREAVEQTHKRTQPEPEPPPNAERAILPASIKKNLEALRILGETKPDEFRDIESKAIKFWDEKNGELAKYQRQWKKEHPEDEFDMDAAEHSKWMEDHEPYVSEEDLEFAKEEAMRRRLRTEVRSEIEPLRRRIAEREAEEHAAPRIVKTVNGSLKGMVAALNPELKDMTDEEIGTSLQEKDPVAAHVLVRTAPSFVPLISETIRLFSGKPYDPNNQIHTHLDRYAARLEQSFGAMPADQSLISDGKNTLRFATRQQMARMNDAEKARHWSVDEGVIISSLRRDWGNETARSYQEYKALVDAINSKTPAAPNSKPAPKAAAPAEPPPEPDEEPPPSRSPSVRSASPAPPPVPADDPSLRKAGTAFFERAGW